jgi:hypothetical protein
MEIPMRENGTLTIEDLVIMQVMLGTEAACDDWAMASSPSGTDLQLTVRHRPGRTSGGVLPITSQVVRQGLWQVGLCRSDELPARVSPLTQRAVLQALSSVDAPPLWPGDIDKVIQLGLFGEVRY